MKQLKSPYLLQVQRKTFDNKLLVELSSPILYTIDVGVKTEIKFFESENGKYKRASYSLNFSIKAKVNVVDKEKIINEREISTDLTRFYN